MIDVEDTTTWTVLIVDDEPDNLGVPQQMLEYYGATVHTATNGKSGLEKLETVTPTFVLLDLSMPEMDGWEMLKRIRNNDETSTLPVIALTAHAMKGDKEKALAAGFDGYITKPFMIDSFMETIKSCLDGIDRGDDEGKEESSAPAKAEGDSGPESQDAATREDTPTMKWSRNNGRG